MSKVLERNHCATQAELAIRFALWATEQVAIPEAERIQVAFDVTRATAYRWRRAYCDATGQEVPPPRKRHDYNREPQARRQPATPIERD